MLQALFVTVGLPRGAVSHVCYQSSARLRCKFVVIKRISSLVKGIVSRQISVQFCCR